MKPSSRSLLLAGLHLALVLTLGGKFLLDRLQRPRFWVQTAPVDPDLPIRGRYVRLQVRVPLHGKIQPGIKQDPFGRLPLRVRLAIGPDGLQALPRTPGDEEPGARTRDSWEASLWPEDIRATVDDPGQVRLEDPLACFIPEHVPDPSRLQAGEALWVEVTLPRRGPLRPIRLGIRREGQIVPIVF